MSIRHGKISLVSISVFLFFLSMTLAYERFKVDDAYISFVYAKNFIHGNGLTYNGMIVEGYSNFIWTIIISPFIGLGMEPLLPARILSIISAGLSIFIIENLNHKLNTRISAWESFISLLIIAISAPFAAWTMGGLETMFMALWVLLFVYFEILHRGKLSFIACLMCALIRPEGSMLFLVAIAHRFLYNTEKIKKTFLDSLFFLIPFSVFIIWRYSYYGYIIPNTAYLKLSPSLETVGDAAVWLSLFFQMRPLFSILILFFLIVVIRSKLIKNPAWSLVFLVSAAFVFFILYSGRDWMPHHRFLVPVILFSCLFIGGVFSHFKTGIMRVLVLVIASSSVILELFFAFTLYIPHTPRFGDYTDGLIRGGIWIKETTNQDDVIAVVDAGALAYYSERKTIDILGLNSEHIAHSNDKSDLDYVLSYQPKVIQTHIAFSTTGEIHAPSKDSEEGKLFVRDDFWDSYYPYLKGAKDPYFPMFFIRK